MSRQVPHYQCSYLGDVRSLARAYHGFKIFPSCCLHESSRVHGALPGMMTRGSLWVCPQVGRGNIMAQKKKKKLIHQVGPILKSMSNQQWGLNIVIWHTKGCDIFLCCLKFAQVYLCSLNHKLAHKQNLTFCESAFVLTVWTDIE